MKKGFLFAALAVIAFSFAHVTTYKVDAEQSTITWTGRKVTGSHTGTVALKNGSLQSDHGKIVGGSFEIDMTKMVCTDLPGETGGKLVGHLQSPDFFGTEKYPTAKFVITRAIATDTKGGHKIVGNLTIKETTKEIKFNAVINQTASGATATGKITIDRSEFDIRFGSGSFFDNLGDKTIYDDFDLDINLVAKI